jgi:outer membrane biosynthesis protein TonB
MAEKGFVQLCIIASFVALVGLLAAPVGTSVIWASSPDQPRMMNKKPMMKAPSTARPSTAAPQSSPLLTAAAPTTLDEYANYVQDRLQAEAMQVKTSGTADLRLTIGKDGSVQQADVTRLEGPAALRDQLMTMARQLKLPPLPTGTNASELVLDTTLAFNYPGSNMMDRFGRMSER